MIRIRLLQLGDIHMGMARTPAIDLKDRRFPASYASLTTTDPLVSATRIAVAILRTRPVDAILLVGDLAHQGDATGYQKCVDYLADNILTEWYKTQDSAFCVPGNHDINRSTIIPNPPPNQIWAKFASLEAAWQKHNLPILATSQVKSCVLKRGAATAEIIALNSCLGCGEYHGLPEDLRTAAHALIEKAPTSAEKWSAIEQVDSPAFAKDHIEVAQQKVEGERKVNVVLAHHNLLPQATPRAALYAELLNGGQFRSVLSEAKCPTLYCHGHIHDDPIEIITLPHNRSSCAVNISAPMLDQGFNVIELTYTDDGTPLGAIVQKYMVSRALTFTSRPHQEIRIPFRSSADYFPLFQPPRSDMIEYIRSNDGARFPALLDQLRLTVPGLTQDELAAMLQEAEWYGLVHILDSEKEPPFWQMVKVSP